MSEKKKIKLITFAPHPNFGTCLQSYALNYVLKSMGHDVEFIYNCREKYPGTDKDCIKVGIKSFIKLFIPKSVLIKIKEKRGTINNLKSKKEPYVIELPNYKFLYLLSKSSWYEKWWKKHVCINLQWRKVYKFTYEDNNFKMKRVYTLKQYKEITDDTDMFITGSDQIWNPYCGGFNPMMFVEFGENKKRIAYSSSIAQSEFPKSIEKRVKKDLSKFNHIGVREQTSVELLNNLLERTDVRLVVDPTYLLTKEEWSQFGEKAQIEFDIPEKYIFCYFVEDGRKVVYQQMINEVKAFTGISEVIVLDYHPSRKETYGGYLYLDAGPYEWVYLLEHSSYVCMDSFHATVFSLKFQKEFLHAMKNEDDEVGSQNLRMYDLLSRYDLMRKNYVPGKSNDWMKTIDYSKINPIIETEIKDSLEFLKYEINY